MNAGKVLACDAPQKLIEERGATSLEEAFIGYMEDAIAASAPPAADKGPRVAPTAPAEPAPAPVPAKASRIPLPVRRMLAYARNEAVQIRRDPVRLAFAFGGSALLMLVFGFGITTDVKHIRYATLDRDQSPESRSYLDQLRGASTYFRPTPPVLSDEEALRRLQADDISLLVEM